ncbi:unnamed protein product [Moneuplotes crassus]|uniref:Uncharacterized protein n=1 Tax=Euplotes crassus TaxID=5936 RepID=A0AAD2D7Z0_EUPCR|nr:unnamed protein product [Moneuplotes crassus]
MKPTVENITIKPIDTNRSKYDTTFLEKYLEKHKINFNKRKLQLEKSQKIKQSSFVSNITTPTWRRAGSITHHDLQGGFINSQGILNKKDKKKLGSKLTARYRSTIRKNYRSYTEDEHTSFDLKNRTRDNLSQQYQKFKISLARSTRKHHLHSHSKPITPIHKKKKIMSNRSHGLRTDPSYDNSIPQIELSQKLKSLEEEVKRKKRAVLKERQMNSMLKEENKNLSKTNNVLTKKELSTTSSSFTINASVAGNIYENFMIKDLKCDLGRIQGQIDEHNGKNKYTQSDIDVIKKDNKAIKRTIEEVKKYKAMLDTKVNYSNNREKNAASNEFTSRKNNTVGVTFSSGGKIESSSIGFIGSQELVRVEKLSTALSSMSKVDNLMDTFIHCVDEMKRIMNRELQINIYLLDESLYHKIVENIEISKMRFLSRGAIDAMNYHVFTNNSSARIKPTFEDIESIKYGSRSNDVMVIPIGSSYSDIMMIVECKLSIEAEKPSNKIIESKMENSSATSEIDEFSNNDSHNQLGMTMKSISIIKGGFNILDEFTFKILLEFVKKRIEIITSKKDAISRKKTGKNLINLLGGIMKISTLTMLIGHWKEVLPEFFGFKDVGILFYDSIKDDLCTAGDVTSEFAKKMVGLDSETVIRFPNTIGVTGLAFKNSSIISRNDHNLNPVVDNISNQAEVKNFMIGAILGDEDKKAGILQFINKIGGEDVKNYDIQRFKAMRHFLGSCAENVTLTAVAINLIIMVKGKIGGVTNCLEICDQNQSEKSRKIDNLDKNVSMIRKKAEDEINHHNKAKEMVPELESFLNSVNNLLPNNRF